jgi:hypothetical protein
MTTAISLTTVAVTTGKKLELATGLKGAKQELIQVSLVTAEHTLPPLLIDRQKTDVTSKKLRLVESQVYQ